MRFLFWTFIGVLVLILVKLFYLQLIVADSFTANYVTTEKIAPNRGRILDRNKQPLTINQTTYLLYVEPDKMKSKHDLVSRLEDVLHIGEATIEARIDETRKWVAVKGGISKELKEQIQKLSLNEVGFQEESRRFYPESSLAAHLIGFVGKNKEGEDTGYFGLEGYYDQDLAGLAGVLKSERDLFGRPIFVGLQDRVEAENGRDIILTVDKTVQHIIKEKLKEGMEQYKAKQGCVIAADPSTMEILGLACLPDFDPSEYYKSSEEIFKNWTISSLYEPGSTFKPLVMAAGIEERVVKPNDIFDEEGAKEINGIRIKNWNDKYEGKITITHILEKSSNIGMMYIGSKLGKEKLYEYLEKYGLGSLTQIDLQGEVAGSLRPRSQFYPIDYATATFGQGIAMTPLQLVRGFAAVINGGNLMRPYVVKEVIEGGYHYVRKPTIERRILSDRTSEIMRKMLISVVGNAEVKWDRPKGYIIGGKTGTAQVAISGNYDASKTIASFIGFAPGDKPKFVVLVVLREPGVSSWGSETAAPIFFEIAKELLIHYNIQPTSSN